MKIDYDFYKHFDNVPITQLAQDLGIKQSERNRRFYLCPCHNDKNPSMCITGKADGPGAKYENRFKCFSCGESGNAFNLAMAALYHITPSQYYSDQKKYKKEFFGTVSFIEQRYPGAVLDNIDTRQGHSLPVITRATLEKVGLKGNFLQNSIVVKTDIPKPAAYLITQDSSLLQIKLGILRDKINDYIAQHSDKEFDAIISRFPKLNPDARRYIAKTLAAEQEQLVKIRQEIDEFCDYHFPITPPNYPPVSYDEIDTTMPAENMPQISPQNLPHPQTIGLDEGIERE